MRINIMMTNITQNTGVLEWGNLTLVNNLYFQSVIYQNITINFDLFAKTNNIYFVAYFDEVYNWNLVWQTLRWQHSGYYACYQGETIRSPGKMCTCNHAVTRKQLWDNLKH